MSQSQCSEFCDKQDVFFNPENQSILQIRSNQGSDIKIDTNFIRLIQIVKIGDRCRGEYNGIDLVGLYLVPHRIDSPFHKLCQ